MKRLFVVFMLFLVVPALLFAYTGTNIGPNVSELDGKKLQWEAGSFDYFVMFKSLVANNTRTLCVDIGEVAGSLGCDYEDNPEGDICLQSSTFTLDASRIPEDAYVEAAYLTWSGSVDPNALSQPVMNTADFSFSSADGKISINETVAASRQGTLGTSINQGTQDFTFEGMGIEQNGSVVRGFYTYRVDITEIIQHIHDLGREAGNAADGISLLGDYTVGGVVCSNNSQYVSQIIESGFQLAGLSSGLIGGWSIILVYRSVQVDPKMVYIYNGFSTYIFKSQDITVSGFEFPEKPKVKVSFHVLEGDPGIAVASDTDCGGACPPEGLSVTGETTAPTDFVILQNDCNPAKFADQENKPFNYSETYNSISSVYSVDGVAPTCIGGNPNSPDPNTLEYTMDVDTFIMDAETDFMFDNQFKKGDTNMFFKIGANGDLIYTNYMVVSVDTKAPRYDIPPNPETLSGREKNYCSCSPEADKICFTAPFYFVVKVQNWGDDLSTNVTIQDKLTSKVSYVPGTTEVCKEWKEANVCKKWEKVTDKNGKFPLEEPYLLTDILPYCDQLTMECPETIMVRFKVLPKANLQKHEVIENTALINDDSGKAYRTNTSIPLRLVKGTCPSASECENPDLTNCGGVPSDGCEKKEDCGDGEICNSKGECVIDTENFTNGVTVNFAIGKNSPVNASAIIVPAPSKGLVMGQFSMMASSVGSAEKYYFFNSVSVSVEKDTKVNLSEIKLVYDENGDGTVSDSEPVVAEPAGLDANTVSFALKNGNTVYKTNTLHHFVVVSDATYLTPKDIPINAVFSFKIDSVDAFDVKDAGTAKAVMTPTPMEFAEYKFEPTKEVFVFTKGYVDPPVPSPSEINESVPVMQIRTKAVMHENTLTKIKLKSASKSVAFGEGIKSVRIYIDANKDGKSDNDVLIGKASASEQAVSLDIPLSRPVVYAENEEVVLLIVCEFSIPVNRMAQIEILGSRVSIDKDVDIIGLPLKSKEFWNKCQVGDINCGISDEGDSGCSLTTVEDSTMNTVLYMLFTLTGLLVAFRKRLFN